MKAIRILMVVLFSFFGFAATAQTYRIYKANGSVVEYATSDVDSIVFIDATTIYYGTGDTVPTSEAEITANTNSHYTTSSTSISNLTINCNSVKAWWIAVPSSWHLAECVDILGTDVSSNYTQVSEISTGSHYQIIGNFVVYYRLMEVYFNQTYKIKVSK